jgi:hypothetical protein
LPVSNGPIASGRLGNLTRPVAPGLSARKHGTLELAGDWARVPWICRSSIGAVFKAKTPQTPREMAIRSLSSPAAVV